MLHSRIFLSALSLFLLSSCNSVPTRRTHNAASIPRFVDVSPSTFREGKPSPVGIKAGTAYGLAFSDVGNVHGSQIFYGGVNYRNEHFAVGWIPYFGVAHVSHEGTAGFGSVLWAAVYIGGGSNWAFSYQNTFSAMNKTNESKGCENDRGFFFSDCVGNPQSAARAEVKVKDVGFLFTAEKKVGSQDSFLIAPSLYWTSISTGNKLDWEPSGDFRLKTHYWSPGLQLGYVIRFGQGFKMLATVMAGAQWVKSFRPDRAERELMPAADIRFQF